MQILKEFVKAILLSEAASSDHDAISSGYALVRGTFKGYDIVALYDPVLALQEWVDSESDPGTDCIIGVAGMQRSESPGVWELRMSAARKGWGPLMHDIAISLFGSVTSDHAGGVTAPESKIWDYYFAHRSDIKKELLPGGSENSPLDYVYSGGKPVNIHALSGNHTKFISDLKEEMPRLNDNKIVIELLDAACYFFDQEELPQTIRSLK